MTLFTQSAMSLSMGFRRFTELQFIDLRVSFTWINNVRYSVFLNDVVTAIAILLLRTVRGEI